MAGRGRQARRLCRNRRPQSLRNGRKAPLAARPDIAIAWLRRGATARRLEATMQRRMARVLTVSAPALAAAALLAAMIAPAASAAPGSANPTPPNFDVSAMHGNEAENAIAINPTNPANIVAMSTLPDAPSGLFEGVSFDGGKNWTRQVIGTGGPLGPICCDEQLAWDRFGNLWMTYLINTTGDALVALSTDGGLTFTKVADIVTTPPTGSRAPTSRRSRPGRTACG